MYTNTGTADRVIRIVLGVVLIAFAVTGRTSWGWIGIVPLLTGLVGFCALYRLIGVNTCAVHAGARRS